MSVNPVPLPRLVRAVLVVAILAVALTLGLPARPAAAHALGGPEPDNFVTTLTALDPPLPGVSVRVVEVGNRLEMTSSQYEVLIIGYEEEPYLRIGPKGVWENQRSSATFLNRDRRGTIAPPSDLRPTDAPEWKRVGSGPTYRYHDHRAHWMGTQLPPEVAVDPSVPRKLPERSWTVAVQITDDAGQVQRSSIKGTIDWEPGPDPTVWFALAGVVGLGLVAAAAAGYGRYAVVAGLLIAILADVVHVAGLALASGITVLDGLAEIVSGGLTSVPGWVIGGLAIRPILRRSVDALYAGGVAGLTIAIFGGYLDYATITSSQIPTAIPYWMARAVVALAIGAGTGTALAAVVAVAKAGRHRPEAPTTDDDGDGDLDGDGDGPIDRDRERDRDLDGDGDGDGDVDGDGSGTDGRRAPGKRGIHLVPGPPN